MKEIASIKDVYKKLMYILTPEQKKWGIVLCLLSLGGAVFETLGVSIIIPFMQAMVMPDKLKSNYFFSIIISDLHIDRSSTLIFLMCVIVSLIYIIKNVYLTVLSWIRAKYSCKIMREISVKVMKSYMKRPYQFFLQTNMGDLTRGTASDPAGVYLVINYGFHIIAEVLTVLCIFIFIFQTDAMMAVSVVALGLLCMTVVQKFFHKKMKILGDKSRKYSSLQTKFMLEAYGGIKEVYVMNRQNYFVSNYEEAVNLTQQSTVGQTVASESPAYVIEAICVIGIIFAVGIRINGVNDATAYIPSLASFAMAAFRIMPSLGRITSALNNLAYNCPALNATYDNLHEVERAEIEQKKEINKSFGESYSVTFNHNLRLLNVTWRYEGASENVISNLNMMIKKGESIGIVGTSGAGKSTLMDIMLGLLTPQEGKMMVDAINISCIPEKWAKMIGYVPQTVYLMDDSIRANVAFGIPKNEISDDKVWRALEAAHIDKLISDLPNGLDTYVGERGVRFSGGQRQRIAIARALYYDPQILVFDEATSALDNETELAVMESIESLHGTKTLIIVAHRLSTIQDCDRIFEIKNGSAYETEKKTY